MTKRDYYRFLLVALFLILTVVFETQGRYWTRHGGASDLVIGLLRLGRTICSIFGTITIIWAGQGPLWPPGSLRKSAPFWIGLAIGTFAAFLRDIHVVSGGVTDAIQICTLPLMVFGLWKVFRRSDKTINEMDGAP